MGPVKETFLAEKQEKQWQFTVLERSKKQTHESFNEILE